jgi:hypothetical protein
MAMLLGFQLTQTPSAAQDEDYSSSSREYRIKAAYIYQFGRYVEWPERVFASPQANFIIGVMKDDPIAADLEQIARLKRVQEHPIRVVQFASVAEVRPCHVLFLSASVPQANQSEIIRRMERQATLLVGESEGFLDWGGTIRFSVEENKVRITIARKAAERDGLTISAKLLQVANVLD